VSGSGVDNGKKQNNTIPQSIKKDIINKLEARMILHHLPGKDVAYCLS